MGKGSGSNTTTTTQQSGPPPQIMQAYTDAINRANTVSQQPYQPYTGDLVAPFSDIQSSTFQNAMAPSNAYYPLAQQASDTTQQGLGMVPLALGQIQQASTPFYDTVGNYESPYNSDVVNATAQQFANTNAIQNAGVVGNAVSQGAWGGDRSAIAQAEVAGQQQQAEAPVLAGLYNTNYQTALGANEAQNWLGASLGQETGNLAGIYNTVGGTQAGIAQASGNLANTQLSTMTGLGALEQAQAQAGLNIPYEQYLAAQAYPFQSSQFFTNAAEGLGSVSGGTSTTTAPGPSTASQAIGLGTGLIGAVGSIASLFERGGSINPAKGIAQKPARFTPHHIGMTVRGVPGMPRQMGLANGGGIRGVPHFDIGGSSPISPIMPNIKIPDVSMSYIPQGGKANVGPGPPKPPQIQTPTSQPQIGSQIGDLGKSLKDSGLFKSNSASNGIPGMGGGSTSDPLGNLSFASPGNDFGGGGTGIDPAATGNDFSGVASDFSSSDFGSDFRRGGIIGEPHYDDGGDLPASDVTANPEGSGSVSDFLHNLGDFPDTKTAHQILTQTALPASGPLSADQAAYALPIIKRDESGNQNIHQHAYSGDGINPSTGTHTPPSSASGYAQYTDSTWRDQAPKAGVDISLYPTAMSAPEPVQDKVALHTLQNTGVSPWVPYNAKLANDLGIRGTQYAANDTGTLTDATPQRAGIAPQAQPTPTPTPSRLTPDNAGSPKGLDKLRAQGVDPWLALMIAGGSMAAGSSPFAMQNIGAGLVAGAKSIQEQRIAGPDIALKNAQATQAQLAVEGVRAFRRDMAEGNGGTDHAVNMLDTRVKGAQKDVADPSTAAPPNPAGTAPAASAQAITPPPGAMGPAPTAPVTGPINPAATALQAGLPPPTPEETSIHNQVQSNISAIDAQIAQVRRTAQYVSTPDQISGIQKQLADLQIRRSQMLTEDPLYKRAVEGGSALATNPAKIALAGGEATAKANAEPIEYQTQGPNGGVITRTAPRGQVIAGQAPGQTGAAAPNAPATDAGKYDPSPESVIQTAPGPGQAGATKVNLTKAQEDKLAADAKEVTEYRDQASLTPITMQRTQQLAGIIHQLNTGPIAEHGYDLFRYAHAIGLDALIPDGYNPANIEEVNKLATSLVFEQLKAIGGRPMVNEIMGLQKANPSVALTPQANLAILSNIAAEAKYTQDRYTNASKVFSHYGQLGDFDQKYLTNSPVAQIYADNRRIINDAPPTPGAIKGSDGNWYFRDNGGQAHRIVPPSQPSAGSP